MQKLSVVTAETLSGLERLHVGRGPDGAPVLRGARCADCGLVYFPPVGICPSCASTDQAAEDMPRSGTLYSETTVHGAPPPWFTPYSVGYVDLPNGARVFGHLRGSPRIGDRVTLTTAVLGRDEDGQPVETFAFEKKEG